MSQQAVIPMSYRFVPGDDLRQVVVAASVRDGVQAGCVLTTVGSLSRARLRFAGQPDYSIIDGDLEILSLVGTLGPDGPHLHLTVADASGRTFGGHMGDGCIVRTTAEVVVCRLPGVTFRRVMDKRTGYRELSIE